MQFLSGLARAAHHQVLNPRKRRVLTALLLAAATGFFILAILPGEHTRPVVVIARFLAPGHLVQPEDVRLAHYPRELVPESALTNTEDALHARTVGPISSGVALTSDLVSPQATGVEAGFARVPITFGDPEPLRIVEVGHRLRIFAAPTQTAEY